MDKEMLSLVYRQYAGEICLYLYTLCQNRETAEDLMQEVFLKALLTLGDSNTNLRAWLYKVARNTCLNNLRAGKRETAITGELEDKAPQPAEQILARERREQLYCAMQQLPDRQREILELFYFSEMSVREIADLTGLTSQNVRVLSHRAKQKLREILREWEG